MFLLEVVIDLEMKRYVSRESSLDESRKKALNRKKCRAMCTDEKVRVVRFEREAINVLRLDVYLSRLDMNSQESKKLLTPGRELGGIEGGRDGAHRVDMMSESIRIPRKKERQMKS